jgi:SagB-type dehydrogenase family enzyme
VLARLGEDPSYGRALILERLGRSLHLAARPKLAVARLRDALDVAGKLLPSDAVKSLRGTLRSELGDALRALNQPGEARKAYAAALKIAEDLRDIRGQGVDLSQLGALALTEGKVEEALEHFHAALSLFQQLGDPGLDAAAWQQLGRALEEAGQAEEAERHYREAARVSEAVGDLGAAARNWTQVAGLLAQQPGRLADARRFAQQALAVWQKRGAASGQVWKTYALLADIAEREASTTEHQGSRAALETQARNYRELERRAPLLFATLAGLPLGPNCGRAVLLGRIGRSFRLGGSLEPAIAHLREAVDISRKTAASALQGTLHIELGDTLLSSGIQGEAGKAYRAALELASQLKDLRGQRVARERLALAQVRTGEPQSPDEPAAAADGPADPVRDFEIIIHEELSTDYAFEPDLLVDGPREQRVTRWLAGPLPLADDLRPVLVPSARSWVEENGAVRFRLPWGEPVVERDPGCTVMVRSQRDVVVSGSSAVLWQLIRKMDGATTVAETLSVIEPSEREVAELMLAALADTGVIDRSGRPLGRFLHWATKKGVLPAGGLEHEDVLELATDGSYREHPQAPRIPLSESVPDRLRAFHRLTRSRRSRRDYLGTGLRRDEFDALLSTACGVTGTMPWEGREVRLRAYPSSGALYAVEIYPVVFRVEGLEPGVYHYRALENVLELVRPGLDSATLVNAALPMEREMVAGTAVMFCLAGCFRRHERKYGEGGYRMLVAESGHISQNLVLAATALGLSARPFGGVFDDLLNHDLGLDGLDEQFLLSVLVGHAASSQET